MLAAGEIVRRSCGGGEAEMVKELIERLVDTCVELVEGTAAVVWKEGILREWLNDGCTEWGVNAVEQLQEQDADPEALRCQAVGLRLGYRVFRAPNRRIATFLRTPGSRFSVCGLAYYSYVRSVSASVVFPLPVPVSAPHFPRGHRDVRALLQRVVHSGVNFRSRSPAAE
jgi:hypothetical protein